MLAIRNSMLRCAQQCKGIGMGPSAARSFSKEKKHFHKGELNHHPHTKDDLKHAKDKHRPEEHDTVLEFAINPVGTTSEDAINSTLTACTRIADNHHLKHTVHPMGVVVEGTLDECLGVVQECVASSLKRSSRVVLSMRADIRPGTGNRLHRKSSDIQQMIHHIGDQNAV
eukprot:TRINITY_DN14250_c0_g1_i1.p1 TRINITY_DN14250_c0_g1~~TRINITY_DN14250_c0_g1_i1.p1  ORF type:complete len:170 (-),score=21.36 TRINITY_DN14250_c0_g1_i1:37-546(-)